MPPSYPSPDCLTHFRQVNAFLVRKGAPGYTTQKMQRKASHRVIQNGDVWLKDVFVPDEDRLPGADSFQVIAGKL